MQKLARRAHGALGSPAFRLSFTEAGNGNPMSPWHDLPLHCPRTRPNLPAEPLFTFVNEIPKGARAKMEVMTREAHNPIAQDMKNGAPRYYHFDSLVNYGCLPQTWEDPAELTEGLCGDGDPVDVVELGSGVAQVGDVYPVKVLGAVGLVDEGEMDWKVLALAASDPLASVVHDVHHLEFHMPGAVEAVVEWFRTYKTPDGKPPNEFLSEKPLNAAAAMRVVAECHSQYKRLVEGGGLGPGGELL